MPKSFCLIAILTEDEMYPFVHVLSPCVCIAFILLWPSAATSRECSPIGPPAHARELGFTKLVLDSCPSLKDVSTNGLSDADFFSGQGWDSATPMPEKYSDDRDGVLTIELGAAICTITRGMKQGRLPLLPASKGFYVEFTTSITDNHPDHFPALWMMPVEHNRKLDDVYDGDPPHFERWQEIDVDEGGFTKGFMGTAISWSGIYPNYQRLRSNPIWNVPFLDRTVPNKFAVSFDPVQRRFKWFLNDIFQYEASGPSVSDVVLKQNFYLIMTVNHRGKMAPYSMKVFRVSAFTAQ
ncbi:hypothetical protein [Bradyrhizobium liaoningense]